MDHIVKQKDFSRCARNDTLNSLSSRNEVRDLEQTEYYRLVVSVARVCNKPTTWRGLYGRHTNVSDWESQRLGQSAIRRRGETGGQRTHSHQGGRINRLLAPVYIRRVCHFV